LCDSVICDIGREVGRDTSGDVCCVVGRDVGCDGCCSVVGRAVYIEVGRSLCLEL
jgi:hypothetical protein